MAAVSPTQKQALKQVEAQGGYKRLVPSWRLAVTAVCWLGVFVCMFGRVQTSFAILCMVEQDKTPQNLSLSASPTPTEDRKFQWSKQYQGLILSAYFYGYVATLVIGGWIADRFPSDRVAMISVLGQALTLALIPELTRLHPAAIVVLRVLQGMAASSQYPALTVILGRWSLDGEFALLFAMAWSGGYAGSAAVFPISGALCQSATFGGWPSIFYLSALLMAAWIIIAKLTVTESPEQHKFISGSERTALLAQTHVKTKSSPPARPISLWKLVTNLQVWIVSLSYFVTSWFFAALNITLPTFMKEAFGFDTTENGLLSALPSISMAVMIVLGGKAFDYLHGTRRLSKTSARKILSTIGLLVPSAMMSVVLVLPQSQRYLSVALIALAQGFMSIVICSGPVSAGKEIAPQHMGLIWGVASSIGNTSGFLVPLVASWMTPRGTLQEWCWFFVIAIAAMTLLCGLIVLGWRSEVQSLTQDEPPEPSSTLSEQPSASSKTTV